MRLNAQCKLRAPRVNEGNAKRLRWHRVLLGATGPVHCLRPSDGPHVLGGAVINEAEEVVCVVDVVRQVVGRSEIAAIVGEQNSGFSRNCGSVNVVIVDVVPLKIDVAFKIVDNFI